MATDIQNNPRTTASGAGSTGGNDTIVRINNSTPALTEALETVVTFDVNTAGAETAALSFNLPVAGIKTRALKIRGDVMVIAPGASRAPGLTFDGLDQGYGIWADPATQTIRIGFDNHVSASFDFCFGSGGSMFSNTAGGILGLGGTASNGVVRDFNSFGLQVVGGTLDGATLRDVVIGHASAEIPSNATQGFMCVPKMSPASGANVKPTGVPLTNGALHTSPWIWDDVNFRIHAWSNGAAGWKSSPVFVTL